MTKLNNKLPSEFENFRARLIENFYNKGPFWPGAPSPEQVNDQHRRLIKRVRRFDLDFSGAAELAAEFETCKPYHRCASGACPKCLNATQLSIVSPLAFACHYSDAHKNTVAVSIMSPAWRAPVKGLHTIDFADIRHELIKILDFSGEFNWLGLGMDVSLNDDTQKGLGVYWQIQGYGIAGVEDQQKFATSLRERFVASSKIVKRPVRVVECDGSPRAFSYLFKTNFVRRVAYWGEGVTHTGQSRECWRTRKVSLRAPEELELTTYTTTGGNS